MKIKDLFEENQYPEWSVHNYVINNIDYDDEYNDVMNLHNVLKNTYIVHTFIDEINSGGIQSYFDQQLSKFRKDLEVSLSVINSKHILEIITKANKIIDQIEKRIGDKILDNIQEATDSECEELEELQERYFEFEDDLIKDLRSYVFSNQEVKFK